MLDIYCDFEDGDSIRTQPGDGGGTRQSQGKAPWGRGRIYTLLARS